MKSAWDKIFHSDAPLTKDEQEQALRELVNAVADVTKVQTEPAHQRIALSIQKKLSLSEDMAGAFHGTSGA